MPERPKWRDWLGRVAVLPVRVLRAWEQVRESFWFVPALMASLALILALATLRVRIDEPTWLPVVPVASARAMLTTVAASAITVASVVFSITMVALTMASQQFGPRLLPNFMRQAATQIAFGTFIGTFLYALVAVLFLPESGTQAKLSVAVGLLLGIGSFGVLIHFLHHLAVSIQAPTVIHEVVCSAHEAVDRAFPETDAGDQEPGDWSTEPTGWSPVAAPRSGYVQAVDREALVALASREDVRFDLLARPGDFVFEGQELLCVSTEGGVDASLAELAVGAFVLGGTRTATQDPEFAVDQLVEIAVRALSPGINDTFTALNCVDRLGELVARLVRRPEVSPWCWDEDGVVRLHLRTHDREGVIDAAFDQVRQNGRDQVAVLLRLARVIGRAGSFATCLPIRGALSRQLDQVEAAVGDRELDSDRSDLALACEEARGLLNGSSLGSST